MSFEIRFTDAAREHLRAMTARERSIVLSEVEVELAHEPAIPSRKRRPMRPNLLAEWELRLGNFRAYYRIMEDEAKYVEIVAVGIKQREQIWIGGERIEL